jgi:Leucine-rich repeat (LRR) protein
LSVTPLTNLITLNCNKNQISSINLNGLTNLQDIDVSYNLLSNLIFDGLTLLKTITCSHNQITELNFTELNNLIVVNCNHNLVETLDFSNSTILQKLNCSNNSNLTSICLKNGYTNYLIWGNDDFLSYNFNLSYICADDFEITYLQNRLAESNLTQSVIIDSACNLNNENFDNKKLVSFYPNPVNSIVNINSNYNSTIKSVTLYDALGRLLLSQEVNKSNFVLDTSNQDSGVYLLKIVTDNGSRIEKIVKE